MFDHAKKSSIFMENFRFDPYGLPEITKLAYLLYKGRAFASGSVSHIFSPSEGLNKF